LKECVAGSCLTETPKFVFFIQPVQHRVSRVLLAAFRLLQVCQKVVFWEKTFETMLLTTVSIHPSASGRILVAVAASLNANMAFT
jgi:hypothetical protein